MAASTRFISPDAQENDLTLAALARRMGHLDTPDRRFMLTLPDGYAFVRPDPYHAALCRRQEETGVALAPAGVTCCSPSMYVKQPKCALRRHVRWN